MLFIGVFVITYSYYYRAPETVSYPENEVNVCLHLSDYNDQTISSLLDLRVSWVRTDWIITPDNLMRDYSQDLQNNNINLLTIIDTNTFNNQKFTLAKWNKTIIEIVNSEGFNNTDAVEIWNEPNGGAFVEPETYYEMLKSAYTIIKNYTTINVVFAGISPNIPEWQTYLNTIFANSDAQDYFDYMGIHFYDDMPTNLNSLRFVKDLTDKPIWLTETGKPSENNDQTGQAEYLSSVYSTFKPLVYKIFIYELNDNSGLTPPKENYFGLLTVNGTKKESYFKIWGINRK